MRIETALATVVLTFSLGATAQAGTTHLIAPNKLAVNGLAANRIVTNRVVANRVVANRLAANGVVANRVVANGVSSAVRVGDGAVADIVAIELPDGTKLAR